MNTETLKEYQEYIDNHYIEEESNEGNIVKWFFENEGKGLTSEECFRTLNLPNLKSKFLPNLIEKGVKIQNKKVDNDFEYYLKKDTEE